MRRKRTFHPIAADAFRETRLLSALSLVQAAELLHVELRTVRNWETGRCRVPYAAYKLLRLWGCFEPPHLDWAGWRVCEGVLWSPDGRAFRPGELYHLRWVFAMAREWREGIGQRSTAPPLPFPAEQGFARSAVRADPGPFAVRLAVHVEPSGRGSTGAAGRLYVPVTRKVSATSDTHLPAFFRRQIGHRRGFPAIAA